MTIDEFVRYSNVLYGLTVDFVNAIPDTEWDFTPDPPGKLGRVPAAQRIGDGFAPLCKQLRHVVCVRGVYNAALATRRVDWTRKHDHYEGPLTREALLAALDEKQGQLLTILGNTDIDITIDWGGTPFTFALFTWEFVQHEAIHHGQWSVYASLAGLILRRVGEARGACRMIQARRVFANLGRALAAAGALPEQVAVVDQSTATAVSAG